MHVILFNLIIISSLFLPINSQAADKPESVCEWFRTIAVEWQKPRQPTLTESKLFRQCAVELLVADHLETSLQYVRGLFAPTLLPRALEDEIRQQYKSWQIIDKNNFELAKQYLGREHPIKLRRAAASLFARISGSSGRCQFQALHHLGLLTALGEEPDKKIFERTDDWLFVAAIAGFPPAMRDFAAIQFDTENRDEYHTAYGMLLAAQNAGLEVSDLLNQNLERLTETQMTMAMRYGANFSESTEKNGPFHC